jgi:hypothetical protein
VQDYQSKAPLITQMLSSVQNHESKLNQANYLFDYNYNVEKGKSYGDCSIYYGSSIYYREHITIGTWYNYIDTNKKSFVLHPEMLTSSITIGQADIVGIQFPESCPKLSVSANTIEFLSGKPNIRSSTIIANSLVCRGPFDYGIHQASNFKSYTQYGDPTIQFRLDSINSVLPYNYSGGFHYSDSTVFTTKVPNFNVSSSQPYTIKNVQLNASRCKFSGDACLSNAIFSTDEVTISAYGMNFVLNNASIKSLDFTSIVPNYETISHNQVCKRTFNHNTFNMLYASFNFDLVPYSLDFISNTADQIMNYYVSNNHSANYMSNSINRIYMYINKQNSIEFKDNTIDTIWITIRDTPKAIKGLVANSVNINCSQQYTSIYEFDGITANTLNINSNAIPLLKNVEAQSMFVNNKFSNVSLSNLTCTSLSISNACWMENVVADTISFTERTYMNTVCFKNITCNSFDCPYLNDIYGRIFIPKETDLQNINVTSFGYIINFNQFPLDQKISVCLYEGGYAIPMFAELKPTTSLQLKTLNHHDVYLHPNFIYSQKSLILYNISECKPYLPDGDYELFDHICSEATEPFTLVVDPSQINYYEGLRSRMNPFGDHRTGTEWIVITNAV